MKYRVHNLFLFLLLVVTSCTKAPWDNPHLHGDEKEVTLKVAMPYVAPKGTTTRSTSMIEENTIETLDVFAFKVENGVETFQYRAGAQKSVGNIEGNSLQEFNVRLRVKDFSQRFVLIANAHNKIEALINSRVDGWVGQEKEAMFQHLILDALPSTTIPMWGEGSPKIINTSTTSVSDYPIPMLRMVAKVEVQLDLQYDPMLTSVFDLKSIHVYNTNTSGRMVPKPGTEYIGTDMIAKKASLPAPVTSMVGPLSYNQGAIYLFETTAKNAGNLLNETCVVVGGLYGTDLVESYYRLDFLALNGTTHVDILRNHKYACRIIAVKGRGYSTIEEAYKAKSFNMVTNLVVWDQGEIRHIFFDDHYMLGVSHDSLTDADSVLKVATDYPSGWRATVWADVAGTTPAPWLHITPALGAGGAQPDEITLLRDAHTGPQPRTAYIHIKAGRLSCTVKVVQEP